MKLRELAPVLQCYRFNKKLTVHTLAEADAIEFDCPGCVGTCWHHRIWAPFLNREATQRLGGSRWWVEGSTLDDFTFIDRPDGHTRSIRMLWGCKSHFNITGGAIDFYGDSGHHQPQETPMSEKTTAPTPSTPPGEKTPPAGIPTVEHAPPGFTRTGIFAWLNGVLHQRHESPHTGDETPAVMVPVPGSSTPPGLLSQIEAMLEAKLKAFEAKYFGDKTPASPPPAAPPATLTPAG